MLNFSKIKVVTIYSILFILTFFACLNFQNSELVNKKVNLGLDLQGGSYLLLEIDTKPLIKERLQNKVLPLKKFLKKNNFDYQEFSINNESITFKIDQSNLDKFKLLFFSKKDILLIHL